MKSLSVKKVTAVAVGAAMIGAAFAGAVNVDQTALGNYKWFSNGEPNVSIVVGAKAQIWDAVAAANLAALIGNLAYSDVDVTGSVTDGAAGNATAVTGSVTGKTVTLEVTTPAGATGQTGQADVLTQLYDFLDVSPISAEMARANNASTVIGDGISTGGYKISPTSHPSVAYSGTVSGVGSYSVKQEDYYFLTAKSYYDPTEKAYLADSMQAIQVTNFTDSLPQHFDIINGSLMRASTDSYWVKNNNIKVNFLGGTYVVTDFTNTTVKLGKESIFRQMKPGESIEIGDKTLKLVSVSPIAVGAGTLPPSYFELSQNGTRLDSIIMDKDTSNYNKNGIILDVRDVFVGSSDSSYAEVALYSSAITLQNAAKVSFDGDDSSTKLNDEAGWTVGLTLEDKNVGGH
ncbi:MAG: S-layer protein, partial [Candidatus Micrarchaeota archaeon]